MSWLKNIEQSQKFLLANSFELYDLKDIGMGKFASFSNKNLTFRFIYDRGPIHCDLRTVFGDLELIHVANYLSGNNLYDFPRFYWEYPHNKAMEEYLRYFDDLIRKQYDALTQFIKVLDRPKFQEVLKYSQSENLKRHKNRMS